MKALIDLTDEAQAELARQGMTAEQALYTALGIDKAEPVSCVSSYAGVPVLAFESDTGSAWFAWAPGHSTFVAVGDSRQSASDQVVQAIKALTSVRGLSRLEQQQCTAIARGVAALYQLEGKEGVVALGSAIAAVLTDKALTDSCYLLACKLACCDESLPDKTKDWAYRNMLKYCFATSPIEDKVCALLRAMR